MKEKKHKSVILFSEWKKPLQALSLEQKGRLLDALLDYPNGVQPGFDDPLLAMAWAFIEGGLEENARKWDEIRERRAEAGRRGNEKRWHSDSEDSKNRKCDTCDSEVANIAVSGSVSGSVIPPSGGIEKTAPAVDLELSKIVQHYQQAVGDFPRSALDKLQKWRQEYSTEMILLAIDKAAEAGKRSWNYINGILSGWKRDGVKCPGDVKALDDLRAKQKANAPRNKAFMASRPPEEAAKSPDFLKNAANRRPLTKKKEEKSA